MPPAVWYLLRLVVDARRDQLGRPRQQTHMPMRKRTTVTQLADGRDPVERHRPTEYI